MRFLLASILLIRAAAAATQPDPAELVACSAEAADRDWKASPAWDFDETDRNPGGGSTTWHVTMIDGTPYQRRIATNGHPLSPVEDRDAQQKLEQTRAARSAESPEEKAHRIAKYRQERDRDHLLMAQMTKAFNFRIVRQQTIAGHRVWVVRATPRAGYRPPSMEAEALTGMNGTLWIDAGTCQWVRVEAHVIRPVSIAGFLARVEPGTFFRLDKTPVTPSVWLASHFVMRSSARILGFFHRNESADQTFRNYTPAGSSQGH